MFSVKHENVDIYPFRVQQRSKNTKQRAIMILEFILREHEGRLKMWLEEHNSLPAFYEFSCRPRWIENFFWFLNPAIFKYVILPGAVASTIIFSQNKAFW